MARFNSLKKTLGQARRWLLEANDEESSRVGRFWSAIQEIRPAVSGFVFCFFGLEIGRYFGTSWFNAVVGDVLGAFLGAMLGIALFLALEELVSFVRKDPRSFRNKYRAWWCLIAVPVYLFVIWVCFTQLRYWGAQRGYSPWIGFPLYILAGLAVADTLYCYFSGPIARGFSWLITIVVINLIVGWLHPDAFSFLDDTSLVEALPEYDMMLVMVVGTTLGLGFLSYYYRPAVAWVSSKRSAVSTEPKANGFPW